MLEHLAAPGQPSVCIAHNSLDWRGRRDCERARRFVAHEDLEPVSAWVSCLECTPGHGVDRSGRNLDQHLIELFDDSLEGRLDWRRLSGHCVRRLSVHPNLLIPHHLQTREQGTGANKEQQQRAGQQKRKDSREEGKERGERKTRRKR